MKKRRASMDTTIDISLSVTVLIVMVVIALVLLAANQSGMLGV